MKSLNLCLNNESYLLPTTQIPTLVYYSHSLFIVLCIVTIYFTFKKNNELNYIISSLLTSIVIWLSLSLLNWVSNIQQLTMTTWTLIVFSEVMIYLCSTYLVLFYANKSTWGYRNRICILLPVLPIIILLPTRFTLTGFNIISCTSVEGPMAIYYVYLLELAYLAFCSYTLFRIRMESKETDYDALIIPYGTILFLLIFTIGNIYGSLTGDWVSGDIGLIGIPIFIIFILYSIIKHKSITTDIDDRKILLIINWILIGSLITVGKLGMQNIITSITLIIVVLLGILILIINSRESKHLSQISSLASSLKDLNDNLESKVTAQTAEIKKSYELERNAHRELIKLSETKDRFISIAQHNLRIPITNIRNKIDRIIENIDRNDGESARLLCDTKESLNNLNEIADDFKSISRINKESNFLNLETVSLLPVIKNILMELAVEIDKLKLDITYTTDTNSWPETRVDRSKIKDALMVVIENAIKYNKPSGYINISTTLKDRVLNIKIKNSGIGLTTSEKNNIETQSFYRSDRAKLTNPVGMGIGLNLAKSTIEAHHGKLEISSEGENLGATVEISIPVDFLGK